MANKRPAARSYSALAQRRNGLAIPVCVEMQPIMRGIPSIRMRVENLWRQPRRALDGVSLSLYNGRQCNEMSTMMGIGFHGGRMSIRRLVTDEFPKG
uniref:Uncharacterized protein n=1 Tax=Hyaloperonospora arabidopsidis (strain Emoy2) TaxID=559515 RepID=M4BT24_HYAAE